MTTKTVSPYIYIGYHCNNNCIFCSEADGYLAALKIKTIDQVKKEIIAVKQQYNFINFMGREPTLRNDFIDIIKFAKQQNFEQIGFTTNGRMLAYPEFTQRILRTGVNQVAISLIGNNRIIHDKQTQIQGSFMQTIFGIKNIIKFKDPSTSLLINIPLNKLNYLSLKPSIDLLVKLGVREINILFVSPLGERSHNKNIIMSMSKLGAHVFKVIKPYLQNPNLKILLVEFLPCSLPKEARQLFFPCLEKNSNKVRISLCYNCPYKINCDGVLGNYINLYTDKEFSL